MKKKVIVYIDGFNLYFGLLRGKRKGLKWLDIGKLADDLKPKDCEVIEIKYFTAMVSGSIDPQKPVKQRAYIQAIKHDKRVSVYLGNFQIKSRKLQINKDTFIQGKVPEEKASDVNLAVELTADAYENKFDTAIVVSNDSDLVMGIKKARLLGKKVNIVCPGRRINVTLKNNSDKSSILKEPVIRRNQLPASISEKTKPKNW